MNIQIDDKRNKEKIAIVVVGYNRLRSIKRLLNSLLNASYPNNNIPLVISIDCSGNLEVYGYVRDFNWPFGDKYVIIQEKRLGLKEHIFTCGDLTIHFKAVIILEDDLFVSSEFYHYVCETVDKYGDDDKIAGIALYLNGMNGYVGIPFTPLNNGSDVFALQDACTSGECWTEQMWQAFRDWLETTKIDYSKFEMPDQIRNWEQAWSKFYIAYMLDTNRYFIFPYISVSTNFGDVGIHGSEVTTIAQANLLSGKKNYNLLDFNNLEKYDIFLNNNKLAKYLNVSDKELCVDLYGNNNNLRGKRYWLSILPLPYKILKSFALHMRPMELNIINDIEGNQIFLYDITQKVSKIIKPKVSPDFFLYHLQGFRREYLLISVFQHYEDAVKRKLKKIF
jgi:hypothetical protein